MSRDLTELSRAVVLNFLEVSSAALDGVTRNVDGDATDGDVEEKSFHGVEGVEEVVPSDVHSMPPGCSYVQPITTNPLHKKAPRVGGGSLGSGVRSIVPAKGLDLFLNLSP